MTRQPPEIQRAGLGQQAVFQMFRIVAASGTTTTTTTTTTSSTTGAPSTTTTTTTTSTTTTAPPCKMRVWYGNAVDAQFDDKLPIAEKEGGYYELRHLEVHVRSTTNTPLYTPRALDLKPNDVVLGARYNGQWYVIAVYGNCPASTQTTSTTTSTTTTSSTRPPTRPLRVPTP
jgi:hypothetical protein